MFSYPRIYNLRLPCLADPARSTAFRRPAAAAIVTSRMAQFRWRSSGSRGAGSCPVPSGSNFWTESGKGLGRNGGATAPTESAITSPGRGRRCRRIGGHGDVIPPAPAGPHRAAPGPAPPPAAAAHPSRSGGPSAPSPTTEKRGAIARSSRPCSECGLPPSAQASWARPRLGSRGVRP